MKLKLKVIRHLRVAQNQAHNAIIWCVVGFLLSYAYTLYDESDILTDWFLMADYSINKRSHVYYMGERFRWMAQMRAMYVLAPCWQTNLLFILEAIYFCDYYLFFNDTNYGRMKGLIMIVIALITIIRWKK